MLATLLATPEHQSVVPGYAIDAYTGMEPKVDHEALAHNGFIGATIEVDGSNRMYPGEGVLRVFFYFITLDEDTIVTAVSEEENAFYISIPANDVVTKLEIIEWLDDIDFAGVNLVVWTKNQGDEPYYQLLIVPIQQEEESGTRN